MNLSKASIGVNQLNYMEIDNETVREIYHNLIPEAVVGL